MIRNRPVSLVLVCLFVWLTGCTSYSPIEVGEVADYGKTRVTLDDGRRFVLAHPQIEADSPLGFGAKSWSGRDKAYADSVRVPLDQVELLEGSHFSAVKTLGLVGGVIAGLFVFAAIVCSTGEGCGPSFSGGN